MPDILVERRESGIGAGMVLGVVIVGLVVVVALFFVFGGPGRFLGGTAAPSQTNVNVPAQSQPQNVPEITIPRQIDINVNQPSAPAAVPAQPAADR